MKLIVDKAIHTSYKFLPLSIWMKQVALDIIDSRTQIALIFKNIFKAASLSCYITLTIKFLELLNKNPPSSIKTFLKSHNKWIDSSYWKIQNDIFPVEKMHYLKPYILELVNFEICFIFLDLELFTKIKKDLASTHSQKLGLLITKDPNTMKKSLEPFCRHW